MSLNIIGYIAFLTLIYFVTIHIGWVFYKNGEHYLHMLLPDESHLVQSINKLLLVGYYLLNLGYCTYSIISWPEIHSANQLLAYLTSNAGFIIFILAVIHYINMLWLSIYGKHLRKQNKNSIHV